jgi:ubiquinone/menaquinone biosynthesis C-methylase UbiE
VNTALVDRGWNAYVENYDRIAAEHLGHLRDTGKNPWQPVACVIGMTALTAGVVRHFVTSGSSILDVGCGPGDLLNTLPDYDRQGLDISAAYLAEAGRKGIETQLGRAEELPYADGVFDCVVCADILEHVLDLHATVSEALRVLKPKGHLIVRVPREDDLSPYLKSEYEFVHLRRFDEPTLQLMFSRIHPTSIVLTFEFTIATEGTLAKEIVCVVRKPL